MGYHGAIILPKTDSTSLNILVLCFFSILCISVISYLIVAFGKNIIAAKLNAPDLVKYLWLTPIFVFFHGLYQTLKSWKIRLRRFDNLAVSRVTEIGIRKLFQLLAGFLGYATAGSLIFADLTASFLKNLNLFKGLNLKSIYLKNKSFFKVWVVAKRYRKFPQYSVWGELLSRLPAIFVSFLIIKNFGQDILGYYGLCLMVLALPSTLIMNSISETLMPRLATAKHEGKHVALIEKVQERLFSLMVFPFLILGIFGDILFSFVFGSEWTTAGVFSQFLVFGMFSSIFFTTTHPIIIIMEKQELIPLYKLLAAILLPMSFIIGGYYNNIYLALFIYSTLQFLFISILGLYVLRILGISVTKLFKKIIYYVFICIILSVVLLFADYWTNSSLLPLFVVIGLCTVIYYFLVLYHDSYLRSMLINSINTFNFIKKN